MRSFRLLLPHVNNLSTITTINSTDIPSASRSVINTNFSNLNTDKIETSYLDTDTTLAADSDTKIPSQKAVKAYVDAVDGSVITCKTICPLPPCRVKVTNNASTFATATTGWFGLVVFPFKITATQVAFYVNSVNVAGTMKLGLYSEDGQTQILALTSDSISGAGDVVLTFTATTIPAGNYYLVTVPVSTASLEILTYGTFIDSDNFIVNVASQPVIQGTATVTSGTLPTSFTPSSITATDARTFITRWDD